MNNNDDKDRWETFCKLYDKLSSNLLYVSDM